MQSASPGDVPQNTFRRWLTRRQVAARYNRDMQTISRWEKEGKLPQGILIGRTKAWEEAALEAFEAKRREEALKRLEENLKISAHAA